MEQMNSGAYNRRLAFIAEPLKSERCSGNTVAEGTEKVDTTASVVRRLANIKQK